MATNETATSAVVEHRHRVPIVACEGCGTIHRVRGIPRGSVAICRTCGGKLYGDRRGSMQAVLALNIAALVLFVMAHVYPFMSMTLEGRTQVATLLTGPARLFADGMWPIALLVFCVATVFPLLRMVSTFWVMTPLLMGDRPPFGRSAFRLAQFLRPWAMMEIFFLGVLVAYVKLSDLAAIELHEALYAFVAAIVLLASADALLERRAVWERVGRQTRLDLASLERVDGYVSCHDCGQLAFLPDCDQTHGACPRCGASLHRRKPDSLARTWALVIAAAVLYIPANVLPIMTVVYFGSGYPDTILSGVVQLVNAGMLPIAILVFVASITVPVLKLAGLIWLLIGVHRGWLRGRRRRTAAYRVIEGIGRWSMIDIFMISILVALVNLGAISTVIPGPGAVFFGAVVILTMLASASFDPRLIWDTNGDDGERATPARV